MYFVVKKTSENPEVVVKFTTDSLEEAKEKAYLYLMSEKNVETDIDVQIGNILETPTDTLLAEYCFLYLDKDRITSNTSVYSVIKV